MSSSHYFAENPDIESDKRSIPLTLPDLSTTLVADRGVFSGQRIDAGTKLLLLEAGVVPEDAKHVLDLGCGYGPIAVALAHRHPTAHIHAVDVNQRARDLTTENLAAAGAADRSTVTDPDAADSSIALDYIASNPPIRIGKPAMHALLTRWLDQLSPTGHADLVVQKHLGSDSLMKWLNGQGWKTTRLCSRAGYRILQVRARETQVNS